MGTCSTCTAWQKLTIWTSENMYSIQYYLLWWTDRLLSSIIGLSLLSMLWNCLLCSWAMLQIFLFKIWCNNIRFCVLFTYTMHQYWPIPCTNVVPYYVPILTRTMHQYCLFISPLASSHNNTQNNLTQYLKLASVLSTTVCPSKFDIVISWWIRKFDVFMSANGQPHA